MEYAKIIAEKLLEIGAIRLREEPPFVWASGWNSPIYCDNRLSLSFPQVRSVVTGAFLSLITQEFAGVEAIAGVATAGIPQAAILADRMGLPMLYVRSSPKSHGMENLIEGKTTPGAKVVVIEDLISTGGSSLKAVEALRQAGYEVMALLAVFSYGFRQAETNMAQANVVCKYLSDYQALVETALQQGRISAEQLASLQSWRENPESWKK